MSGCFNLRFESYDHVVLDHYLKKIVEGLLVSSVLFQGPVMLPNKTKVFTLLASPFIYKRSRRQFGLTKHKRLIILKDYPMYKIHKLFMLIPMPHQICLKMKEIKHVVEKN